MEDGKIRLGRRVVRNTQVTVVAEMAGKVSTLVLFAVMARELGSTGFGDFVFAVSIAFLLSAPGGLGTDDVVAREIARDPTRLSSVLWNSIAIKSAVGGVTALAAAAMSAADILVPSVAAVLPLVALAAVAELLAATAYSVFQGLNDLAPEAAGRTLQSLVRCVAGIAVLLLGGGLQALALTYVAGSAVALVYIGRLLVVRCSPRRATVTPASAWRLASAGLPIAVAGIFDLVSLNAVTVLVGAFEGSAAAGLFGAGQRLVASTLFVATALTTAILPVLAGLRRTRTLDIYEAAVKAVVVGLLPLTALFVLFAEPMMRLLYGESFTAGAPVVRLLAAVVLLHAISELSATSLIARGRQPLLPWIAGIAMLTSIGFAIWMIPARAEQGGAIAALAGAAAYAALAAGATARAVGRPSVRRIAIAPTGGIVAMLLTTFFALPTLPALLLALVAYCLATIAIEMALYPADVRWIRQAFRQA